jgi:hypothetical protein
MDFLSSFAGSGTLIKGFPVSPNVEGQPRRELARRVRLSVLDSMVSIREFIL